MKKVILAVAVLGLAAAVLQTAQAGSFRISVNLGWPVVYSAPVTCAPPPPVVVYAPPAYCAPAPVVVYRAPAYYAPAPVASFRYGYGGGYHRSHHDRW